MRTTSTAVSRLGFALSTIFFPLRSNVEWFETAGTVYTLNRKIKESMLLCDHLVFESGTYTCTVTERGSWDFHGPSMSREERERRSGGGEGGDAYLAIEDSRSGERTTIISGQVERNFYADFLDILEPLHYQDLDFIELMDISLTSQGKKLADQISWRDIRDDSLTSLLQGTDFLKKKVIDGLNHSLVLSSSLRMPILVDALHENILSHKLNLAMNKIYYGKTVEALDSILQVTIPDFSSLDADRIVELRKDKALIDFREEISKIVSRVSGPAFEDPLQFREEAQRLFVQDLIQEIGEMAPTGDDVLLDVFLGVVPYIGEAVDIAKTAYEAYEYSRSWSAFLFRLVSTRR